LPTTEKYTGGGRLETTMPMSESGGSKPLAAEPKMKEEDIRVEKLSHQSVRL
jgi:hypothetical protein